MVHPQFVHNKHNKNLKILVVVIVQYRIRKKIERLNIHCFSVFFINALDM